jgi:hypothetical protein
MTERKTWEEQAAFMRATNAVHAEWDPAGMVLIKLVLGPPPVTKTAATEAKPDPLKGVAARLMRQHEIQFAHSTVKPPLKLPGSAQSDVPRAVSAKQGASRGSKAKVSKRAS